MIMKSNEQADQADHMINTIKEICENFGPRASGEKAEKESGDFIEKQMQQFCTTTRQEGYTCHPKGFLGFIRYAALLALIAIILYIVSVAIELGWLPGDLQVHLALMIPAVACGGFSMLYLIAQVMTYHHLPFIDALFPEKTSYNIIGTVEPKGEIKRTVIVSGHHDSQYEFNLFYYLKTFGGAVVFLGFGGIVLMTIVFLLRLILLALSIQLTVFFIVFMVICIIFIPIACMCMFFVNMNKPVMGAFDNLSAVAILLEIGKHFGTSEKLENTRVMLVSFAGEEAGLRGSSAFIKEHIEELKKEDFFVVNLDGIGEKDKVIFTRTEPLIGVAHDKWMNDQLMDIAKKLGIKARLGPLPFGGTDAARFSQAKIKTTNINAFDLGAHLPHYYHNRNDTLDVVDKEALAQVYDIVVEFIKRVD